MILRSVMKHVRDQNWFAVFLDFLIVVVGVFIGIQVSNWNDDRAERSRESGILTELAADLCADLDEIESTTRVAAFRFSAVSELLSRTINWTLPSTLPLAAEARPFPHPELVPVESATVALNVAQRFYTFDVERAAYDGLVSSNEILLIRNRSLVDSLQSHYARIKGINDNENTSFRATMERLVPALERNGLGALEALEWSRLERIVNEDDELQGILKNVAFEAALQVRQLGGIADNTGQLLARLDPGSCQ